MTMRALVELALAINEEERQSDEASSMVQKALEKHRAEREEAASNDIVELLRMIDSHKTEKRQSIRQLKATLKKTIANLGDLDRRWAYAQKTNNFIPVLEFFNKVEAGDLSNPSDFAALSVVPGDFKA